VKEFFKYHSLGNDFIIAEDTGTTYEPEEIMGLCDRHIGIGADGVLIFKGSDVVIYNSDGSNGQICLNGARCVAFHLHNFHNFPKKITITMGHKKIEHIIEDNLITQYIEAGSYQGEKTISIDDRDYKGGVVDVGNPHFVVPQKTTIEWLIKHGSLIEYHEEFPDRTNIEFIWPEAENSYKMLIYERGCGITLACSSGAAAIITLLSAAQLPPLKKISLHMPGGTIICWQTEEKKIALQAEAVPVFKGVIF
jgi:diaminopimelate epimerase